MSETGEDVTKGGSLTSYRSEKDYVKGYDLDRTINSDVWKSVEYKFSEISLSERPIGTSEALDIVCEHFNEKEFSFIVSVLQDLVYDICDVIDLGHRMFHVASSNQFLVDHDYQRILHLIKQFYPQLSFIGDPIKTMLFLLALIDSESAEIIEIFTTVLLPLYRSLGVSFCEIVCNEEVSTKTLKFLSKDSIKKSQSILLDFLKNVSLTQLNKPTRLNVIHMTSSCGDYVIVEKEIEMIDLNMTHIDRDDATALGRYITKTALLSHLCLRGCKISPDSFMTIHEELKQYPVKISYLDISHVRELDGEGIARVGQIVKGHFVDKLDMSCCGLDGAKVQIFCRESGIEKIAELDLSGNKGLSVRGAGCIGGIVEKHSVEILSMARCGLDLRKLESFISTLGDAKLKQLYLQQEGNNWSSVLSEISKLFSKVTEFLDVSENLLSCEGISILQDYLHSIHPTELEVKVDDSLPVLTSGISSGEYWSKPAAHEYLQNEKRYGVQRACDIIEVDKSDVTIEVGGCSITFESGTFSGPQTVSVTAGIGSAQIPENYLAISPILNVDAENLMKDAKIKLHTWCVRDDENDAPVVQVMHYSDSRKLWEVIHTCSLPESRYIEFKHREFSPIRAFIKRIFSISYVIQPIVYISEQSFAISVLLDSELARRGMQEAMADYGEHIRRVHFRTFRCKKHKTVHSRIFCSRPSQGFDFYPPDEFRHSVEEIVSGGKSFTYKHLESSLPTTELTLEFQIHKKNSMVLSEIIKHTWRPGDVHDRGFCPQPPQADVPAVDVCAWDVCGGQNSETKPKLLSCNETETDDSNDLDQTDRGFRSKPPRVDINGEHAFGQENSETIPKVLFCDETETDDSNNFDDDLDDRETKPKKFF